jgi:hypothetical protein
VITETALVDAARQLPVLLEADARFVETSGRWSGTMAFGFGDRRVLLTLVDGTVTETAEATGATEITEVAEAEGRVGYIGPVHAWAALAAGGDPAGLTRVGDRGVFWRYHAAVGRVVEVLMARAAAIADGA